MFKCRLVTSICPVILILVFSELSFGASSWSSGNNSWSSESVSSKPSSKKSKEYSYGNSTSPFSPDSNNIALDFGQVFLMGDLGNKVHDNIGLQAHYTYGISELFGFDATFGYSSHNNEAYTLTTLLPGVRMNLAWFDKVIPNIVFGLGFFKPTYKCITTDKNPCELATLAQTAQTNDGSGEVKTQIVSDVLFGLHVGPGITLEVTKQLYFGANVRFHDIFGTKVYIAKKEFEISGTYTTFFLHGGVTF
jgi:hypothetical protein